MENKIHSDSDKTQCAENKIHLKKKKIFHFNLVQGEIQNSETTVTDPEIMSDPDEISTGQMLLRSGRVYSHVTRKERFDVEIDISEDIRLGLYGECGTCRERYNRDCAICGGKHNVYGECVICGARHNGNCVTCGATHNEKCIVCGEIHGTEESEGSATEESEGSVTEGEESEVNTAEVSGGSVTEGKESQVNTAEVSGGSVKR